MHQKVVRATVTVATAAILALTGACNHKGDAVDPNPGGGNDVPGEDGDGGGY